MKSAARATIYSPRLARLQRTHALLLLLLPVVGTMAIPPFIVLYGIRTTDVLIFVLSYFLTTLGVTVGYHRLFAHRAFVAPDWIRMLFGGLGSTAGQGSLNYWVANHRRHHSDSDGAADPHSPHRRGAEELSSAHGLLHAQAGWTLARDTTNTMAFARDLLADPVARAVNRHYFHWLAGGLILPALIGVLFDGGVRGLFAGFLWGGPVRLLASYHATSLVNSAGHLWGSRPNHTGDHSRNVWWLALVTLGEGWHNNHHAFPRSARFGRSGWQPDPGGAVIGLLGSIGLASKIVRVETHYRHRPDASVERDQRDDER